MGIAQISDNNSGRPDSLLLPTHQKERGFDALALQQRKGSLPSPAREENTRGLSRATLPRMTVNAIRGDAVSADSIWKGRIPDQAFFYDEIDKISQGYRERGVLLDRLG